MLSVELHRTIKEAANLFLLSQSPNDISNVLEIPLGQLIYLLYKKDNSTKYHTFNLPKKRGGSREISSPISGLSILQQKLFQILEYIWEPRPWVQGFVKTRSILTNSRYHRKKIMY